MNVGQRVIPHSNVKDIGYRRASTSLFGLREREGENQVEPNYWNGESRATANAGNTYQTL